MATPNTQSQPKPRRLPPLPLPTSNPALAAALQNQLQAQAQKSTPSTIPSVSPAAPSTGTPATGAGAATGTPGTGQAANGAQATPAATGNTPANAANAVNASAAGPSAAASDPAQPTSVPESAPTGPTDHPTADETFNTHTSLDPAHPSQKHGKVYLAEEADRLALAFKTTALRAADIMRFQAHIRRLNVSSYVRRVPYALSNSLAREVEKFDEAADQLEAALLKAYGIIYAELERRRALERAAHSPSSAPLPSRAPSSPASAVPGSNVQPSQPASPRPTTSHSHHERPHPPPLNTRLSDTFPQRPSALPRPSAVHLSALPNTSGALPGSTSTLPGSSSADSAYPQPPPSRHAHPGLSLDLSTTKLFGLSGSGGEALASPVTLAPKPRTTGVGGQQSPVNDPSSLLPPEILSALQGVDLSALQGMQQAMQSMQQIQQIQQLQGMQMSPQQTHAQGMGMQLHMSPHQEMPILPGMGGLMSPAHIGGEGDGMGYLAPPSQAQVGQGSRPGTSSGGQGQVQQAGAGQAQGPSAMDGMDIDFLDIPGPVRPLNTSGDGTQTGGDGQVAASGQAGTGQQKEGDAGAAEDQAMGDILASLGGAEQGDGTQPSATGTQNTTAANTTGAGAPNTDTAAQGDQNMADIDNMGDMDFSIPGLDDQDFLTTFTKTNSPSGAAGPGGDANAGGGGEMDFGHFDLGELPELNFAGLGGGEGTGDGGLDFAAAGLGDLGSLGGMSGLEGMGDLGGGEGMGGMGGMDFGQMGDMAMDMDFGSLGDMLGGGAGGSGSAGEGGTGGASTGGGQQPAPGGAQASGEKAPAPAVGGNGGAAKPAAGGDGGMDDDGMIDLDGAVDLDELFRNFGGDEGDE